MWDASTHECVPEEADPCERQNGVSGPRKGWGAVVAAWQEGTQDHGGCWLPQAVSGWADAQGGSGSKRCQRQKGGLASIMLRTLC